MGMLSIFLLENIVERNTEAHRIVTKLFHVLLLWFAAFSLLSISKLKSAFVQKYELFLTLGLFLLGALYFFLLPSYPLQHNAVHTIGLFVFLHLLITVLPFWKDDDLRQYWAYNKTLLLRFLESSLYTLFIFASLSIALFALEKLFGVNFKRLEVYADLYIVLLSFFHPLYFFSRFPSDLVFDNTELESSFAFRVFARRILVPIVLLYGLILLAYIVKLIGLWSWPRGWVSNMVLWFSVFGTLAYLLNYIRLDEKENSFVRGFKKYYFHFQAIMSLVLLVAIYKRIHDYGITEPRYIVASLGLWLLLISSYFVVSERDNIKWIPSSLAFVVLISTLGPFNMHNTTIRSQFKRFKTELTEAKILDNGVLRAGEDLSKEMGNTLSHRMWVLDERNALHKLKDLDHSQVNLPVDTTKFKTAESPLHFRKPSRYNKNSFVQEYAKALGIPYRSRHQSVNSNQKFNLHSQGIIDTPVKGFDKLIQFRVLKSNIETSPNFTFSEDQTFLLYTDSEYKEQTIPLNELIEKYSLRNAVSNRLESIYFNSSSSDLQYRFFLRSVIGEISEEKVIFESMHGLVLIKKQEPND